MDSTTPNKNSLLHLLMKVGHKLHHGDLKKMDEAQLFKGLSAEEQTQLTDLLNKLLASWKELPTSQPAPKPTDSTEAKPSKKDKKHKKNKKAKAGKKAKKNKKAKGKNKASTSETKPVSQEPAPQA